MQCFFSIHSQACMGNPTSMITLTLVVAENHGKPNSCLCNHKYFGTWCKLSLSPDPIWSRYYVTVINQSETRIHRDHERLILVFRLSRSPAEAWLLFKMAVLSDHPYIELLKLNLIAKIMFWAYVFVQLCRMLVLFSVSLLFMFH